MSHVRRYDLRNEARRLARWRLAIAVIALAVASGSEVASAQQPSTADASSAEIPIQLPGEPGVPGRTIPDGLLCLLGDSQLRLSGFPMTLAQSPDGKRGYALTNTTAVDVVDLATLRIIETFEGSDSRLLNLAVSPDGNRLAVVSLDGRLSLWDVSEVPARLIRRYEPFVKDSNLGVWSKLSCSRDRSRFCVSVGGRAIVYDWSPEGLTPVFEHEGSFDFGAAFLVPRGDRLILHTSAPPELQLWDLTARPARVLHRLDVDKGMPSIAGARSDTDFVTSSSSYPTPNARRISIANDRVAVNPEELAFAEGLQKPVFFDGGLRGVGYAPKQGLAIFDCSGETWRVIQELRSEGRERLAVLGASEDGSTLYGTRDQLVCAWRRKEPGGEFVESTPKAGTAVGKISESTFLADSTLIVSTESGSVHAISLAEPTRPKALPPVRLATPLKWGGYLVPHPAAREFVIVNVAAPGTVVQVRDDGTGFAEVRRFTFGNGPEDYQAAPWSAGYSPNGRMLAVGFWNKSINLYENQPDGLVLRSSEPNMTAGHVCVLTFAPHGRSVACGDFSRNAMLFRLEGGTLTAAARLPQFGDAVRNAAFNAEGTMLALGSQNGEIRLCDITAEPPTSRQLLLPGEPEVAQTFNPHGGVTSMQWVARGRLLLTAKSRGDGTYVCLWKMPAGLPIQQWKFTGWMRAAISPDGYIVSAARSDGTACVLQVSDEVQKWLGESPSE